MPEGEVVAEGLSGARALGTAGPDVKGKGEVAWDPRKTGLGLGAPMGAEGEAGQRPDGEQTPES